MMRFFLKLKTLAFLVLVAQATSLFSQNGYKQCLFDQKREAISATAEYQEAQKKILQALKNSNFDKNDTIITIPVVVHVIYKDASENISPAQIQSQIDVLNEDFSKLNADTTNVEAGFSLADIKLSFCLAQRTPSGGFTTGVTRTQTNVDDIGLTSQYYSVAPIWDRDRYLNIWVCDLGPNIAGFAEAPGSPVNRDGVVIHFTNFGRTGNIQADYDLGRTTTHEVGHWFNLLHPWGSNESCNVDDQVSDTPLQGVAYSGCPSIPQSSCGSKDMLSNFMGYVFDRCMGNFTEGQKARMRATIASARSSILQSNACLTTSLIEVEQKDLFSISPNPSHSSKIQIQLNSRVKEEVQSITLFTLSGKEVKCKTIATQEGYEVNIGESAKGIYFLKLDFSKGSQTKKVILL